MSTPSPSARLHALDALRASALLLGVLLHAAMAYLPGIQGWAVRDPHPHAAFGAFVLVVHSFRLEVFFLLAGFFGRMLYHRIGPREFARNRVLRILVPMAAGWFLVFPLLAFAWVWGATGGRTPPPAGLLVFAPLAELAKLLAPTRGFSLGHLWFLYYLTLIYVVALGVRSVGPIIFGAPGRGVAAVDALTRLAFGRPWGALLLTLGCWPVLLLMKAPGVDTPDKTVIPAVAPLLLYGGSFVVGWFLHRQPQLLETVAARWRGHLAVAVVATVVTLVSVYTGADGGGAYARAIFQFYYAALMWSWTLALLALFLRFRRTESAVWRYLADASYWVYIIHLPIVALAQVALAQSGLSCWAKFAVVAATGAAFSILSYQLLVRATPIGLLLNGRRRPFFPQRRVFAS